MSEAYRAAVHGWVDHLLAGGREPWGSTGPSAQPPTGALPSAVNLALLHRLNLSGGVSPSVAKVVATVSLPGRGSVDAPLAHRDAPTFGTPPVDPAAVGDEELLRVAVAVLARLAVSLTPAPEIVVEHAAPLLARRFRVHGLPMAAAALRQTLLADGWVEGDFRATHFVLGAAPAAAVADLWEHRLLGGGAVSWPRLWRKLMTAGLPPRLDLPALAGAAARGSKGRVHVCVAATTTETLAQAGALAGVTAAWLPTPPTALALRARINQVLAISGQAGAPTRSVLDELLAPVVAAGGDQLGVPRFAEGWATEQWAEMGRAVGVGADLSVRPGPRSVPVPRVLQAATLALSRI